VEKTPTFHTNHSITLFQALYDRRQMLTETSVKDKFWSSRHRHIPHYGPTLSCLWPPASCFMR